MPIQLSHTLLVLSGLLLCLCEAGAIAGDVTLIPVSANDPALTCSVLEKKLPPKLSSIRHLGKLQSEIVAPDHDYCENQANECSIHSLKFTGLRLELLVHKDNQTATALTATLSGPQWRLLGDIRVGQKLEVLESHYGVKIPRDKSPVRLEGECTPLDVMHANGHVTKLFLDCQACI